MFVQGLYRIFASNSEPNNGPNSYSVFGRIVTVGPNMNNGHVTFDSAFASQRHLQLQSSPLKLFLHLMNNYPKNKERMTFGPHGISLFTGLELLLTTVHYSCSYSDKQLVKLFVFGRIVIIIYLVLL